jgi:hypothetical protein
MPRGRARRIDLLVASNSTLSYTIFYSTTSTVHFHIIILAMVDHDWYIVLYPVTWYSTNTTTIDRPRVHIISTPFKTRSRRHHSAHTLEPLDVLSSFQSRLLPVSNWTIRDTEIPPLVLYYLDHHHIFRNLKSETDIQIPKSKHKYRDHVLGLARQCKFISWGRVANTDDSPYILNMMIDITHPPLNLSTSRRRV